MMGLSITGEIKHIHKMKWFVRRTPHKLSMLSEMTGLGFLKPLRIGYGTNIPNFAFLLISCLDFHA